MTVTVENLRIERGCFSKCMKKSGSRVGRAFPVMVKINSEDFLDGGFTVDEMVKVAHMLEDRGMDAIEMSGGTFESGKLIPSRVGTSKSEKREVYYRKAAEVFKKEIKIPLILVGGFLSFNVAEEAVNSGLADYVALSRPLIREPHLVARWARGRHEKGIVHFVQQVFFNPFHGRVLALPC